MDCEESPDIKDEKKEKEKEEENSVLTEENASDEDRNGGESIGKRSQKSVNKSMLAKG